VTGDDLRRVSQRDAGRHRLPSWKPTQRVNRSRRCPATSVQGAAQDETRRPYVAVGWRLTSP